MKKSTMRKYLIVAVMLIIALAGYTVLATNDNNNKNDVKKLQQAVEKLENFEIPDVASTITHPSQFFVGPQGQVRIINGEITVLGTTSPIQDAVKVWGLSLKVDRTNAKYLPAGTTASDLKVGDKVNIKGTMNNDTGVITASMVHVVNASQKTIDNLMVQIRALIEKIRALQTKAGLPLTPLP